MPTPATEKKPVAEPKAAAAPVEAKKANSGRLGLKGWLAVGAAVAIGLLLDRGSGPKKDAPVVVPVKASKAAEAEKAAKSADEGPTMVQKIGTGAAIAGVVAAVYAVSQ